MKKGTFEYIKQVLSEYNDTDRYIAQIERGLRVPWKEEDVNSGIQGTKKDTDTMFGTMWTIETHQALNRLKVNKAAVDELLKECGQDTETIIRELYIKKFPNYTMTGLVEHHVVRCGRNKAIDLRDKFFENLAKALNI